MPSEFKALWRAVGVDHLSEGDVEKYLQNGGWCAFHSPLTCPLRVCTITVGLAAMQGEERKRKVHVDILH